MAKDQRLRNFCKFCDGQKELVDAHIIPKAFYTLEMASIHFPMFIASNNPTRRHRALKGIYDKTILCAECDNKKFGQLDYHAAKALLHGKVGKHESKQSPAIEKCYNDANPKLIYDFILSVAWRASVSTHKFFDSVSLGRYEGIIKQYLDGGPAFPEHIDVFVAEFDSDDVPFRSPEGFRIDEVRFLLIYANRFVFYLKIDRRPTPCSFQFSHIRDNAPVLSTVRNWSESYERKTMQSLVHPIHLATR